MQLVAEYKIEFHGDEAVGVLGVVAVVQRGSVETIMGLLASGCWLAGQCWAVHPGKHGGVIMSHEESISLNSHSINFPRGVVHRVENGWGLTKVAAVLLNGLLW